MKQQFKKIIINLGLSSIKALQLAGKLLSQSLRIIAGFFHLLFKNTFYKILVNIYYGLFRLKKNELTKKTVRELTHNQLVYISILGLVSSVVLMNLISPSPSNALANNISKTVLAHLILPETDNVPIEKLITETALSNQVLSANRIAKSYNSDLITKNSLPWSSTTPQENNLPIFNKQNNLVFKPIITSASSTLKFGNEQNNLSPQRTAIVYYIVKNRDTISAIARHFGITINTILWANNLTAYSLIQPGDKLTILPTSGILYQIVRGDTISDLAQRYDVKSTAILSANNLNQNLKIGQRIIIPNARPIKHYARRVKKPITTRRYTGLSAIHNLIKTPPARISSAKIIWPTVGHTITQYYSWHHRAIDIANRIGTPIYAAASGRVLIAQGGWNGGYGNTILLDNGNHMRTRYAHASKLLVRPGQTVKKGQVIALMGSTGNSTGPHLHFEILINGIRRNPLNYVHY